jgi:hypothetical protein
MSNHDSAASIGLPSRRNFLSTIGAVATVTPAVFPLAAIATPSADPVFAAIERHKQAFAYCNEAGTSEEECGRRVDLEGDALFELAATEPTTPDGACSLLNYLVEYDDGCAKDPELFCQAMTSVAAALRKIWDADQ